MLLFKNEVINMTLYTKLFIENNIDDIEYLNYDVVIKSWYDKANRIPGFYEDVFFDEFMEIMSVADPKVLENTKNIREELLRKEMFKRIKTDHINLISGAKIEMSDQIPHVVTKLGLSDEVLTEFADDTANKLGLQIMSSGVYKNT
jgi:hypothetical protein